MADNNESMMARFKNMTPQEKGGMMGILGGLAKNVLSDQPAHQNAIKSRAISNYYHQLQGIAPESYADLKAPSTLQAAIDGGLMGANFGKQFKNDPQENNVDTAEVPDYANRLPEASLQAPGGVEQASFRPSQLEDPTKNFNIDENSDLNLQAPSLNYGRTNQQVPNKVDTNSTAASFKSPLLNSLVNKKKQTKMPSMFAPELLDISNNRGGY